MIIYATLMFSKRTEGSVLVAQDEQRSSVVNTGTAQLPLSWWRNGQVGVQTPPPLPRGIRYTALLDRQRRPCIMAVKLESERDDLLPYKTV